jgi:gliding motility-associated-like protein
MKPMKLLLLFLFTSTILSSQVITDFSGVSTSDGSLDHTDKDQALYNNPHGIDIAPDGTIYVADRFNHVIRKISTDGTVTTIAGNGAAGDVDGLALNAQFNEPWGVSAGNDGQIFVADAKNNKIKVILPNGMVETYAGTGNVGFSDKANPLISSFYWPGDVEFDHTTEDLYVSGHLSHLIRKIDKNGNVSTIAGTKTGFPNNFGSTDGLASQAKFYRPYGIHLDEMGNLFVADEWNCLIRKISPNGIVSTLGGQPETAGYINGLVAVSLFNFPWDVTTDNNGFIYVLDGVNHVIRKIDPSTNETTLFAGTPSQTGNQNGPLLQANLNGATNLQFNNNDGSLYIADAYNHVIRKIIIDQNIKLQSSSDAICRGDSTIVTVSPAFYDNYYWYSNNELIQVTTVPECTIYLNETSNINVVAERAGSALTNSDTIVKNVLTRTDDVISLDLSERKCVGDTITLSSGHPMVSWNNGENTPSIKVSQDSTYSYEYLIDNCVVANAEIEIVFNQPPVVDITKSEEYIRLGSYIDVSVSGASTYKWSNGSINETIKVYSPNTVTVIGTSLEGCHSNPKETTITYLPQIIAVSDTIIVPFQQKINFDLLANDIFIDTPKLSLKLNQSYPLSISQFQNNIELYNDSQLTDTVLTFNYELCDVTITSLCALAQVILIIEGAPTNPTKQIDARPDTILIPFQSYVNFDLLANDDFEGNPIFSIDLSGSYPININQLKTRMDIYNEFHLNDTVITIEYQICDETIPTLCDAAEVTLLIQGPIDTKEVNAKPDTILVLYETDINFDLLVNDDFEGEPIISIDLNGSYPIEINQVGNSIDLYNQSQLKDTIITITYQICDETIPTLCDVAEVTILIKGPVNNTGTAPFFPNGYSPNNDGKNDSFEILGIEEIPENNLEVYNRWGQLVYSKEDYINQWEGNNDNQNELIEGTYFYIFINTVTNFKYNGYVIIKR